MLHRALQIETLKSVHKNGVQYMLLAFISLKMEMSWRYTKIGKVHPNLPFYKKFTQEC